MTDRASQQCQRRTEPTESSQLFDDGRQCAVRDTLQLVGHAAGQSAPAQVLGFDGPLHQRHVWAQLHTPTWESTEACFTHVMSCSKHKHFKQWFFSNGSFLTLYDSCKIGQKPRHTQSKLHAVLGPFGWYAWCWSPLKGDTLRFVSQQSESL